jgi:hypothetical protein
MMRATRFLGGAAAVLAMIGAAPPLHADEAGAQDKKAAEALFREGRALLGRGQIDAACDKLAQSQTLEPSGGTLMNLADCHEKQGKTATAFGEFLAAEELSKRDGRNARAAEAKRRAAALESRLSRLTILVPQTVPGLEVRRNDQLLRGDQLGVAVPVDPGSHRVTATAPGYEPAALDVTLGARADAQTVTLPELQPQTSSGAPTPSAPAPAPETTATTPEQSTLVPWKVPEPSLPVIPPDADESARTTIGWAAAGSGIALAGAGGVFYLLSLSANERAERGCPVQGRYDCSDEAIQAGEKRDTYATLATIGGVAGIAGIGVGAWLLLTSPSGEPSATPPVASRAPRLVPAVAPQSSSLLLHGVFP